jgi:hypothetical protein
VHSSGGLHDEAVGERELGRAFLACRTFARETGFGARFLTRKAGEQDVQVDLCIDAYAERGLR